MWKNNFKKRVRMWVCITDSLCCTRETNNTVNQLQFNKNLKKKKKHKTNKWRIFLLLKGLSISWVKLIYSFLSYMSGLTNILERTEIYFLFSYFLEEVTEKWEAFFLKKSCAKKSCVELTCKAFWGYSL